MDLNFLAVGVDFSAASLGAARLARQLASKGSTLRLVHVIDSAVFHRGPTYGDPAVAERFFRDLGRAAQGELDALAEEPRVSGLAIETVIRIGRPADQILAATEEADLVLMGTHGRGALGRVFLGSVAEEVVRRSAVPVLVVREGIEEKPIERVLLAIDPTGPSRDAIRAGAALADRLGARLEAIHAAHLPPVLPYADSGALDEMAQVLERHLEAAPVLVKNMIEKTVGRDVKVHVVTGSPAAEIVRHAGPGDLVVCGTHGRSALGRFVFGSVAAKLLRETRCPILVVRPAEDESSRDELALAATASP